MIELVLNMIYSRGIGFFVVFWQHTTTKTSHTVPNLLSPTHWWLGTVSPYLVWLLTFQSSVDVILTSLGAILPFVV
jgi:hypothetical protein